MALFGGKDKKEAKKLAQEQARILADQKQKLLTPFEIHVMPQKFVGAEVRTKSGKAIGSGRGKKVMLIAVIGVLIVGLLAFGAYQLYVSLNRPIAQPQPNENANLNVNQVNTNVPVVNTNVPVVNENTNAANVNANTNTNAANTNTNTNANTNINTNTNVNAPAGEFLPSLDIDSDRLTDVEEELYGTELRQPDTDADGYIDGDEVKNLYSPLLAGNNFLKDSPAVNTFTNDAFKYSCLYPSSWLAKATDASKKEVMFTSATGEYFMLTEYDNPDNTALSQWVLDNQTGVDANGLIAGKTRSGLQTLSATNGMLAFIAAPTQSRVYSLKYEPGSVRRLNFLTTFVMMVNSFNVQ